MCLFSFKQRLVVSLHLLNGPVIAFGWPAVMGAFFPWHATSSLGGMETDPNPTFKISQRLHCTCICFDTLTVHLNIIQNASYLLGLLAMIKCSICSYQCDNWYASNWRLACHIIFAWGGCQLGLPSAPQMLPWHGTLLWATHPHG